MSKILLSQNLQLNIFKVELLMHLVRCFQTLPLFPNFTAMPGCDFASWNWVLLTAKQKPQKLTLIFRWL